MCLGGGGARVGLRGVGGRGGGRVGPAPAEPDRRGVHRASVLRQSAHGDLSPEARPHGEPQARAAADARLGSGRHGARTGDQQAPPGAQVYPYLLRGVAITRPNQVWSTDITDIRLAHGFAYLVAIIDWYSRRVLAWRLSNTLEAGFCVDCLEDALRVHGQPAVFNTDQGSQFTSAAFTGVLLDAGIEISMDGRGRALDNIFVERLWRTVKYEDVYIKGYASLPELLLGLTEYFAFYNGERPHQSLGYRTPDDVYRSGDGGGACIVDRFGDPAPAAAKPVREAA